MPSAATTQVRESFARQTFMQTLGATLKSVEEGTVEILLPKGDGLLQQHGYLHAGAVITVIDSSCGYAALSMAPEGSEVLTSELKVNLLAPATGDVVAKGRVIRAGRTLTVCQGDAFLAKDPSKHIATMLATMVTVRPP
jgi:uncharacterized protein (TIGR00369 family)